MRRRWYGWWQSKYWGLSCMPKKANALKMGPGGNLLWSACPVVVQSQGMEWCSSKIAGWLCWVYQWTSKWCQFLLINKDRETVFDKSNKRWRTSEKQKEKGTEVPSATAIEFVHLGAQGSYYHSLYLAHYCHVTLETEIKFFVLKLKNLSDKAPTKSKNLTYLLLDGCFC